MKRYTLMLVLIVYNLYATAQFVTGWEKQFGGAGNDEVVTGIATSDNKIVLVSKTTTNTKGSWDVLVQKLNFAGVILWEKRLGDDKEDVITGIVETKDKDYILVGYTYINSAESYNAWVVKISKNGDKEWSKTYGGSNWDVANAVLLTADNRIVVTGFSYGKSGDNADLWTFALDVEGAMLWEQYYGGDKNDKAYAITELDDKSLLVAGYTASKGAGGKDYWILELDSDGKKKWSRTFGGEWDDNARSLTVTSDGNVVLSGYVSYNNGMDKKLSILKVNAKGEKQWEKRLGIGAEVSLDVCELANSHLLSVGYTKSKGRGRKDAHVVLFDKYGNQLWEQTYGKENDEQANVVIRLRNGSCIIAGYTKSNNSVHSDICVRRLDVARGEVNPPVIEWLSPTTFDKKKVTVKARISSNVNVAINDAAATNVRVNGKQQAQGNIYEFETILKSGKNSIHLSATNEAGTTTKDIEVYYIPSSRKPVIELVYPRTNISTARKMIKVKAEVYSFDEPLVSATKSSNDEIVKVLSLKSSCDTIYRYEIYVKLEEGKNKIGIFAKNASGEANAKLVVTKRK